jgi:uncharacterized protein DUF3606
MADPLSKQGKQDSGRINVNEVYELRDWARSLGVSEDEVRSAVVKVGPMASDVRAHLEQQRRK